MSLEVVNPATGRPIASTVLSAVTASVSLSNPTGIAARAPRIPASSAPTRIEISTASGESCTVRP